MAYPSSSYGSNGRDLQSGDNRRIEPPPLLLQNKPGVPDIAKSYQKANNHGECNFSRRNHGRILFEESPSMTNLISEESSPSCAEEVKVIYFSPDNFDDDDTYDYEKGDQDGESEDA